MDQGLKRAFDRIRFTKETEQEIKELEIELKKTYSGSERNRLEKMLLTKRTLLEAILKDRGKIRKEKDDDGLLVNLKPMDNGIEKEKNG